MLARVPLGEMQGLENGAVEAGVADRQDIQPEKGREQTEEYFDFLVHGEGVRLNLLGVS